MSFLQPKWPAPATIRAYTTLRYPGRSLYPYAEFNLAQHVGDDKECVIANRQALMQDAALPTEPAWLNQTHSGIALFADRLTVGELPTADATYTQKPNIVCVVMTADCLPVLVTNKEGTEVAAIHAGWQGLLRNIIENTLNALASPPKDLLVWIGPSIQPAQYEVGEDFYNAFAKQHAPAEMQAAFMLKKNQKWLANMPLLAAQRLQRYGVIEKNIYLSQECTYTHAEKYFSYRRDGVTGRMASLIYFAER